MSKVAFKTSRQGTVSLYLQTSRIYHSASDNEIDNKFLEINTIEFIMHTCCYVINTKILNKDEFVFTLNL